MISRYNRKKNKKQRALRIQHDKPGHSHEPLKFPKNFLWGSGTSAYQIEGNNIHNDWSVWEQQNGHMPTGEAAGLATDHYNLYDQDFKMAENLHHNAYRMSIEWSRIEPVEGEWDWEEVEHYREVLKNLQKRGIKVMLTLHHFTNPLWVAQQGGWQNKKTVDYFSRYAEFIAEHLGEYVDYWLTLNEPMVYIAQSYILGLWPPQEKSYWKARRVFWNLVKAHRLAYREIHAEMKKQHKVVKVGIAKSTLSLISYRNKLLDYIYIRTSEYLWNDIFYSFTKTYHDFIGVNYYFHNRVTRDGGGKFIFVDVRSENRESSDLGWEIYAPGLFDVLMDRQKYNLPIYITENGIATINDDKRTRFIVSHLKELYHATKAGIDVRGYFHWALLDNFEWDKGYEPRFGLIGVDYKTMERTIRPSAQVYARICTENAIAHDLLKYVGHGN